MDTILCYIGSKPVAIEHNFPRRKTILSLDKKSSHHKHSFRSDQISKTLLRKQTTVSQRNEICHIMNIPLDLIKLLWYRKETCIALESKISSKEPNYCEA
jgi:hypothetical protein